MAATAQTICDRALKRLAVVGVGETPTDNERSEALDALNAMMFGWATMGVDVSHTALGANDTQALGDEWDLALEYLLAEHIASPYETSLSPEDAAKARRFWNALAAAYMAINAASFDYTLTLMPSQDGRYSLANDRS